jgi:hypothetical protein
VVPSSHSNCEAEVNINLGQGTANVTLSERNLRDLLRAYERNPHTASLHRLCEDGTFLYVTVQADDVHYNGRVAGPGIDANVGIGPAAPHSKRKRKDDA